MNDPIDVLGDSIISLIVEYLCEDHTETELQELVDKAIRYANGGEIRIGV